MVLKFLGIKKTEYFLEAEPQSPNGSEPATKEQSQEEPVAKPTPDPVEAEAPPTPAANKVTEPAKTAKAKTKKEKKAKSETPAVEVIETTPQEAKAEIASLPASSTNFATDHLIPVNTPRRRPGPSLDLYKDMARQMGSK
jgi:outer membrane biosynthesis protein TonB